MENNFIDKFFLCDKLEKIGILHSCQTLYLDIRFRKISHELAGTKFLAKLSEGGLVATEAKNYRSCLVQFYKKSDAKIKFMNNAITIITI